MGGIIKLFTIGKQKKALANEALAFQNQAALARQQARQEEEEGAFNAVSIREQAAAEIEAITASTAAEVAADRFNARQLEASADLATADANINEVLARRQGARGRSSQIAAIATSGFDLSEYDDVTRISAEESLHDALLIRRDGQLKNLDFMAQSLLKRAQAEATIVAGDIEQEAVRTAADNAARSALFTATTRSRASTATSVRALAGASSARSKKGLVAINAVADAASDIVSIAGALK